MSPDLCLSLAELVWIIIIAYNSNITMNIDMCFCGAFEQWTNQNGQQWVYTTASIKWQCGITYIHFPKTSQEEIRAYVPKFSFLHWIKRWKEPSCPQSPGLGIWRILEVSDCGFGSWSWWEGVYNVPNNLFSAIQLFTLNKNVKTTPMSWTGDLEDSGGPWLEFRFLIMMGRGL